MNKKVKIGILGCADVVRRHAINALKSIENVEVVSIASRDYDKAKAWASDFGIKAEESYEALIANNNIDAVYIPLPIGLHEEWVLKVAKAGKHIICEKSLTDNLESAVKMIGACRSAGVVLYENFMCDYHPQHHKVLEMVRNADIGKSSIFRGYFGFNLTDKSNIRYDKKLGGGSLNDAGAYTVFMARKILKEEPISVTANLFYETNGGVDIKGAAILEFFEGKTALIGFSFDSMYQNNYSLWGQGGVINVNRAYSITPELKPDVEFIVNNGSKEIVTQLDIPAANHFELIFSDFCDTILNKDSRTKKIQNTYSNILGQAQVMEALRISAREKRLVKITEL